MSDQSPNDPPVALQPVVRRRCDTCEWWVRDKQWMERLFGPSGHCNLNPSSESKLPDEWCSHHKPPNNEVTDPNGLGFRAAKGSETNL